jgi:hypothetical protein
MKTAQPDRILAHMRWLHEPHIGRAVYMVERNGRIGFVPAREVDTLFEEFFPSEEPDALNRALEAEAGTSPGAAASAAAPGRAFPCSISS